MTSSDAPANVADFGAGIIASLASIITPNAHQKYANALRPMRMLPAMIQRCRRVGEPAKNSAAAMIARMIGAKNNEKMGMTMK